MTASHMLRARFHYEEGSEKERLMRKAILHYDEVAGTADADTERLPRIFRPILLQFCGRRSTGLRK